MALKRAAVLTPWQVIVHPVHGNITTPAVAQEYQVQQIRDITGQPAVPTTPNVYEALVIAEESVMAAIDTDSQYYVLWEEYV